MTLLANDTYSGETSGTLLSAHAPELSEFSPPIKRFGAADLALTAGGRLRKTAANGARYAYGQLVDGDFTIAFPLYTASRGGSDVVGVWVQDEATGKIFFAGYRYSSTLADREWTLRRYSSTSTLESTLGTTDQNLGDAVTYTAELRFIAATNTLELWSGAANSGVADTLRGSAVVTWDGGEFGVWSLAGASAYNDANGIQLDYLTVNGVAAPTSPYNFKVLESGVWVPRGFKIKT